ncbi:MAG: hypothetical protein ACRBCI_05295 [Cellvibrionaceae bacterium]
MLSVYHIARFKFSFLLLSITLSLAACGGGGGGSGGDRISDNTPLSNRIFVYDSFNTAIASIANSNPNPGLITLDTTITGSNTNLDGRPVGDMVINKATRELYVASGSSILVFNNANTATGNIRPNRVISSSSFGDVRYLHLDINNDVIYASDTTQGIWVIRDASTANGIIVPERSITNSFGNSFSIEGIAVDLTKDILYVSVRSFSPSSESILVFDNASLLDGSNIAADRTFTSNNTGGNPGQLIINESTNELYMADAASNRVRVFNNAHTNNGTINPDRTINLPGQLNLTTLITHIEIDFENDRLYSLSSNLLEIVQNISLADGGVISTQLQAANINTSLDAVVVAP